MASTILNKLQWRYATKRFDPTKKLGEDKLHFLKESFNLTATSFGLQPLKLVVISDAALKEKLMAFSFNQPQVRDASHLLILCVEKKIDRNFIIDHFKRVEGIRNTPRKILEPFEENLIETFTDKNSEEIKVWMTNQLYLALGTLLTVCAVEKIDSCPMEGFLSKKFDELLGLDKIGLESVILLPVGYRDETDFFRNLKKVRRGVEELVIDLDPK